MVGDFRTEEPTEAQKESLYLLHEALKKDMPNYKRTRGHNEFPGYAWKQCPVFDYKAVISRPKVEVANLAKVIFEGKSVPAFIDDGRTYVQVRELAELLGLNIEWNQQTSTVVLSKGAK